MSEVSMSERLKFLIPALGLKIGPFSRAMGVSDTNIRNYLERGSKPGADFLEKLVQTFDTINPAWLLTGKGEPFLVPPTITDEPLVNYTKNNFGKNSNVGINSGAGTQHIGAADAAKTLAEAQAELALAKQEIESLRSQLARADALVASKDETITLLRATYNRPN